MADILYVYKTSIYANLTNKCPCRCTFCIRNNTDAIGNADTLWHKHDPSIEEIKKAVDDFDLQALKNLCSAVTASLPMLSIILLLLRSMSEKSTRILSSDSIQTVLVML